MKTSEQVAELHEALAEAQGDIDGVKKNSKNPMYNSEYADLAAITDVIRAPMKKHGLSIVEDTPVQQIHEKLYVVDITVRLCHKSGQWMEIGTMIPAVGYKKDGGLRFDAQTIGAAITYGRRYLLQNLFNLAAEDDDGNSIKDEGGNASQPRKKAPESVPQPKAVPKQPEGQKNTSTGDIDPNFQGVLKMVNNPADYGIPQLITPKIMASAAKLRQNEAGEEEWAVLIENIKDAIESDDWSWA